MLTVLHAGGKFGGGFPDGIAGVKVAMNRTSTEFPTCHKCRSLTRERLHGGLSSTIVGADKIGRITPKGTITEFPTAVELSFRAS